ncbi:general transcription repressor [Blyttiomyces sp. JEL0837]|nr:general transcription repressor [Blyttiomyces sp. JEL0837]
MRICVVKRHNETIVIASLFHFGVEMIDMFDPFDPVGYENRSDGGVFWQRITHRVKMLPWILHNIARECFPELVAKMGKNVLELPGATDDVRFSKEEIDQVLVNAEHGDQHAIDFLAKHRQGDWDQHTALYEESAHRVVGWPLRHRSLPFWYPRPSLIVAESSLWDAWSWKRGGLMNEDEHLLRLSSGKWKRNFKKELLGPIREVFPEIPLVLRTTPIPTRTHSPVVVKAINEETRSIAREEGLRVLDWGSLPIGTYDGYHADENAAPPPPSQAGAPALLSQGGPVVFTTRLPELLDALRQEFEILSQDASMFKMQRDDFEIKLSNQINELTAFQHHLLELDKAHQKMKATYEEEISRLKKEIEMRLGSQGRGAPPTLQTPNVGSGGVFGALMGSGPGQPPLPSHQQQQPQAQQPQQQQSPYLNGSSMTPGPPGRELHPAKKIRGEDSAMPSPHHHQQQQQQQQQAPPQHLACPGTISNGDYGDVKGYEEKARANDIEDQGPPPPMGMHPSYGPQGTSQFQQQPHMMHSPSSIPGDLKRKGMPPNQMGGQPSHPQQAPQHLQPQQQQQQAPLPSQPQGPPPPQGQHHQMYPHQQQSQPQQPQQHQPQPHHGHPSQQPQPSSLSSQQPAFMGGPPHQQQQQQQQQHPSAPHPHQQQHQQQTSQQQQQQNQQQAQQHAPNHAIHHQGGIPQAGYPPSNVGGMGMMGPGSQQQQVPYIHQPETGVCDLDSVNSPAWRKQGADWTVVYNPKSPSLNRARLNVDLVHNFEHHSVVCCVKFSLDGQLLATGCNRVAKIYEVASGRLLHSLVAPDSPSKSGSPPSNAQQPDLYIRSVSFSPDRCFLATGAEDRLIRVWDLRTGQIRHQLKGHQQDIYSLDWSRNGARIVSGSGDRSCRVWEAESGRCLMVLLNDDDRNGNVDGGAGAGGQGKDSGVTSVAIHPLDFNCLATGSLDRMVRIWDLRNGRLLERFEGHRDSVYSVAFSPDGRSLVSGSLDKTLKVWDLSHETISALSRPANAMEASAIPTNPYPAAPAQLVTVTCRQTFVGHKDFVLSVAFAGVNGSMGRVDERGEPVSTAGGEALAEVEWVVSGSKDRTVTFWDGRALSGGSMNGAPGGRPSGDLASVALFTLKGHANSIISVSLASVGGLFATGSGDTRARIWRVSADRGVSGGIVPAGPHSAKHVRVGATPPGSVSGGVGMMQHGHVMQGRGQPGPYDGRGGEMMGGQ